MITSMSKKDSPKKRGPGNPGLPDSVKRVRMAMTVAPFTKKFFEQEASKTPGCNVGRYLDEAAKILSGT